MNLNLHLNLNLSPRHPSADEIFGVSGPSFKKKWLDLA